METQIDLKNNQKNDQIEDMKVEIRKQFNQYMLKRFLVIKLPSKFKSQVILKQLRNCKREEDKLALYDQYETEKDIEKRKLLLCEISGSKRHIKIEDIIGVVLNQNTLKE